MMDYQNRKKVIGKMKGNLLLMDHKLLTTHSGYIHYAKNSTSAVPKERLTSIDSYRKL